MAIYGEVKNGDIVYAWDNSIEKASLAHFVYREPHLNYTCTYYDGILDRVSKNIATPEEYHKLLNQPKDKDLVEAWDGEVSCARVTCFYDAKNDCIFFEGGERDGMEYDYYKVIPKDQWPEWAHEAYPKLED